MIERIQLRRTKGWRMPANTIVVARPGKWGNQYRIGEFVLDLYGVGTIVKDQAHAVELHRVYMNYCLHHYPKVMRESFDLLRGHNLACWCKIGDPCHGDTLLEFANRS